jgi:predicted transcriptional regulator of viral defense system
MPPSRVRSLVDDWHSQGKYTFTREDVISALGGQWRTTELDALRRLVAARRIVRPHRGFYVVVPLEYRSAGTPPASMFIHDLMAYLGRPYYVGLLSAAELYGAAHHAVQQFQVVTDREMRSMRAGRLELRFIKYASAARVPIREHQTETGTMRVSTPEATAFDLLRFREHAGELNHIATVLEELAPAIDRNALEAQAHHEPTVFVRRLGYLLDQVGAHDIANSLVNLAVTQGAQPELLHPTLPRKGAVRDPRWNLYINAIIEHDSQ